MCVLFIVIYRALFYALISLNCFNGRGISSLTKYGVNRLVKFAYNKQFGKQQFVFNANAKPTQVNDRID